MLISIKNWIKLDKALKPAKRSYLDKLHYIVYPTRVLLRSHE
jgi:hypothetical protein